MPEAAAGPQRREGEVQRDVCQDAEGPAGPAGHALRGVTEVTQALHGTGHKGKFDDFLIQSGPVVRSTVLSKENVSYKKADLTFKL